MQRKSSMRGVIAPLPQRRLDRQRPSSRFQVAIGENSSTLPPCSVNTRFSSVEADLFQEREEADHTPQSAVLKARGRLMRRALVHYCVKGCSAQSRCG
jgi:hypothetical protein